MNDPRADGLAFLKTQFSHQFIFGREAHEIELDGSGFYLRISLNPHLKGVKAQFDISERGL